MGCRSLLAILNRRMYACDVDMFMEQFCLWKYNHWSGHFEGDGIRLVKFLADLVKTNKWDEFVGYLDNITVVSDKSEAFPDMDEETFQSMSNAYDEMETDELEYDDKHNLDIINKTDKLREKLDTYKNLWPTVNDFLEFHKKMYPFSPDCGILNIIMQSHGHVATKHYYPEWAASLLFCEFAYVINIPEKKLHVMCSETIEEKDGVLYRLSELLGKDVIGTVRTFTIDDQLEKKFIKFIDDYKNS